jgi:hypothetical protein
MQIDYIKSNLYIKYHYLGSFKIYRYAHQNNIQ